VTVRIHMTRAHYYTQTPMRTYADVCSHPPPTRGHTDMRTCRHPRSCEYPGPWRAIIKGSKAQSGDGEPSVCQVSPKAKAPSNQCIIHALMAQKSSRPFAKVKGGQALGAVARGVAVISSLFAIPLSRAVRIALRRQGGSLARNPE